MSRDTKLSISIITTALVASLFFVGLSFAQTDSGEPTQKEVKGITFPIAELGNCADKKACRAYCDDPANADACIAFGKAHGLINDADAKRGQEFAKKLRESGGPGGCKTPGECKQFCSVVENVEACLVFAKANKIKDAHVNEAERIAAYLKSGGTMPGSCTSKESCHEYCSDFTHAQECKLFAEKAGLTIRQGDKGVPPGQFQKFIELASKGETPGACKSEEACKTYCQDAAHRDECRQFAVKAGFIKQEDAQKHELLAGKGPGGCSSREECQRYCDDSAHRDECFAFAKEHNLVPAEKLEQAKEGLVRFRAGVSEAPPEVQACLKSRLGENIIADIQSGELTPGPEIGDRTRECFEKFGKRLEVKEAVKQAPAEAQQCLKDKLGDQYDGIKNGKAQLTPELADAIRVCKEQVNLERRDMAPGQKALPDAARIQQFIRSAPPEVQACLKDKLSGRELNAIDPNEQMMLAKACFEQFKPSMHSKEQMQRMMEEKRMMPNAPQQRPGAADPALQKSPAPAAGGYPPAVIACLKQNLTPEQVQILARGGEPQGEVKEVVARCYTSAAMPARNTPAEIMERSRMMPPSDGDVVEPQPAPGTAAPQTDAPQSSRRPRSLMGNIFYAYLELFR